MGRSRAGRYAALAPAANARPGLSLGAIVPETVGPLSFYRNCYSIAFFYRKTLPETGQVGIMRLTAHLPDNSGSAEDNVELAELCKMLNPRGETHAQLVVRRAIENLGGARALAARLGVHRETVRRWAAGKRFSAGEYSAVLAIAYPGIYGESSVAAVLDPEHLSNWARRRRDGRPMFTPDSARTTFARELIARKCIARILEN